MNECQRESDCERRKTRRRLAVGCAHDDEQEHHGHDNFREEASAETEFSRRVIRVAICRKTARKAEIGRATGNQVEHRGAGDCANHLSDNVRSHIDRRKFDHRTSGRQSLQD